MWAAVGQPRARDAGDLSPCALYHYAQHSAMLQPVTTAKKPAKKKAAPEGRKKSKLTAAGDAAKLEAERALLLKTLKAHDWNLTHTSEALDMGGASSVLVGIDRYGLRAEYEKARGWKRVPVA